LSAAMTVVTGGADPLEPRAMASVVVLMCAVR
jgi:hypothetical protein